MKTTALPVSRPHFQPWPEAIAQVPAFVALTKPRVMALAVFTAAVGLVIAPGHVDPLLGGVSLIAIVAGAGAAGALNMWFDADIDALMTRTAGHPIPKAAVTCAEAPGFGLALACGAVALLAAAMNVTAAALDRAPGDSPEPAATEGRNLSEMAIHTIGLTIAVALTAISFWVANTSLLWAPGVLLGLAALAIAQMGVHLVFILHITTGPDGTNNVLALALGILIVILVAAGSIFIMANLNDAMMPPPGMMHMPMRH